MMALSHGSVSFTWLYFFTRLCILLFLTDINKLQGHSPKLEHTNKSLA